MSDVVDIYPTKVLIKQLDLSDEVMDNMQTYLIAQYHELYAERGYKLTSADWCGVGGIDKPMLDNEYILEKCPELNTIKQLIEECGLELALANSANYEDHTLINKHGQKVRAEKFKISSKIESTNINITRTNERMHMHTHYGDDAFGVFYLTDVGDNDGGNLVLYDPRWQKNYYFAGNKKFRIQPKRGLLVVAPNFMWHEIEEYYGEEDRISMFFNLSIQKELVQQ